MTSQLDAHIRLLTEPVHNYVDPTNQSSIFRIVGNEQPDSSTLRRPLVVFTGPSGAGKDTIMAALLDQYDDFSRVPTASSRERRADEAEDAKTWMRQQHPGESFDAYVLSLVREHDLIEHEPHNSAVYGLPRKNLYAVDREKIPVIDTNPAGASTIEQRVGSDFTLLSFLVCPDQGYTLVERIRRQRSHPEERIAEAVRYLSDGLAIARYALINPETDDIAGQARALAKEVKQTVDEAMLINVA